MNKINICFVTDENYAPHVGVAITSIIHHCTCDTELDFYIFDAGIKSETKEKLNQLQYNRVSINYVGLSLIEGKYANLSQTAAHISKASYFKFAIADLLPQLDKIIYLDGDLVVKKPLNDLYDIELGDNLLAAVEDVGYTYWSKSVDELKLKFKCMNSGVMLINCNLWRKENLSQKLIDVAKNHDIVGFGQDQPVLNYVCRDRILFIPFEWNVQDTFFRNEVEIKDRDDIEHCLFAKNNSAIIHYTYVKKPWHCPCMNMASEYWFYCNLSPLKSSCHYDKYNEYCNCKKLFVLLLKSKLFRAYANYQLKALKGMDFVNYKPNNMDSIVLKLLLSLFFFVVFIESENCYKIKILFVKFTIRKNKGRNN